MASVVRFSGGPEIARALARIEKSVANGLARGAIGRGADVIRDTAKQIAQAQGLGKTGTVTTSSGNTFERLGQIPGAIFAEVAPKSGKKQRARVGVDASKSEAGRPAAANGAPHWIMVEFGSVNNGSMPFMRPGLSVGAQPAVAKIVEVLADGIKRYNKPGG